jgi:transcriptional regulator with PAS, ATPase and Fis domain
MKKILVSWIGNTDLEAPEKSAKIGLGPIAQAATKESYDEIVLLSDYSKDRVSNYITWLKLQTKDKISVHFKPLSGPTQFGEIYDAAVSAISEVLKKVANDIDLTFHLSPGTPAMAAVWIILSKTRFPAELIESSVKFGVQTVSVPFDISAEFIPDLLRKPDKNLERLSEGLSPEAPEFRDIVHRSAVMKRVIAKARRIAPRSVPVLIEGESGTGKELLARAIYKSSPRGDKPFVAVNCGAIPSELIEAELFGYEKGAFTGAVRRHIGYFEAANNSTLFLDEIAELPLTAQVKILRAIQEQEIVRIGATSPIKIDVRIISATNKSLIQEVAAGKFRADLYYRLAVAVLYLPPLRERTGDLGLLIEKLLDQINHESFKEPGYIHKKISVSAKNLMLDYHWPGNVRELMNVLRRTAVWSSNPAITTEDVRESLIPSVKENSNAFTNYPLDKGVNLSEIMANLAREYLSRALKESGGNKTKAARLLGLPNYQTLSNWITKYGVIK